MQKGLFLQPSATLTGVQNKKLTQHQKEYTSINLLVSTHKKNKPLPFNTFQNGCKPYKWPGGKGAVCIRKRSDRNMSKERT